MSISSSGFNNNIFAIEEFAFNTSSSTTSSDTTSFSYGPGGALIRNITANLNRRVRFVNAIKDSDTIIVEVSTDQVRWFPVVSNPTISTQNVDKWHSFNSIQYGMGKMAQITGVDTDLDISFGQYASSATATTYGGVGTSWSSGAGAGYWRVRKISTALLTGYTVGSVSIVPNRKGVPPPDNGLFSTNTTITSTTWATTAKTTATLSNVPAGNYLASAYSDLTADGTLRYLKAGISTTLNTFAANTTGQNAYGVYSTTGQFGAVRVDSVILNLTATTTVYLVTQTDTISGVSAQTHRLQLIRIG